MVREILFAVALLCAGALISIGAALWSLPAAFIVGGALLAGWSWLVLSAPAPKVDG